MLTDDLKGLLGGLRKGVCPRFHDRALLGLDDAWWRDTDVEAHQQDPVHNPRLYMSVLVCVCDLLERVSARQTLDGSFHAGGGVTGRGTPRVRCLRSVQKVRGAVCCDMAALPLLCACLPAPLTPDAPAAVS